MDKIEKSDTMLTNRAGRYYIAQSPYITTANKEQGMFMIDNKSDKLTICIDKIYLFSYTHTFWRVTFNEQYIKGGTQLVPVSTNREKKKAFPSDNITIVGLNREHEISIESSLKENNFDGNLTFRTGDYQTMEILAGTEVILGKGDAMTVYATWDGGIGGPANCDIRFHLE